MKRLGLLTAILLAATAAFAQGSHWELGLNAGYLNSNDFKVKEYSTATFGLDVAWMSHTSGDSSWWWERYPMFGVRASFAAIPDGIAGHRFGVVGLIRVPMTRRLAYNIGLGLSAYTEPRWITHNKENIYISSLLCCLIDLGLTYRLSDHIHLSGSLLHSSNGNMVRPNKGLNFLQLGMAYSLGDIDRIVDWHDSRKDKGCGPTYNHEVGFTLSSGLSMSRHMCQYGIFYDYDVSLNYLYRLTCNTSVGGTVDLWYNCSHTWQRQVYNDPYPIPMYVSAMFVLEQRWGPVSLKGGVGASLIASSFVDIPIYERAGVYYNWGRNYVGVAVNAHAAKAEFIEWSYGRRFPIHR